MTPDPLERFISDWIKRHLPQQPGVPTISAQLAEDIRREFIVLQKLFGVVEKKP